MKEKTFDPADIRTRRRRSRRMALLVVFLLFLSMVGAFGAWMVFRSPIFRVAAIEVAGNRNASEEKILEVVRARISDGTMWQQLFGAGNLLAWTDRVTTELPQAFPIIKHAEIQKNYADRRVTLRVAERDRFGIWCGVRRADGDGVPAPESSGSASCWWFDEEGIAFEETFRAEGSLLHVVNDYTDTDVRLGTRILPTKFLPPLFSILRVLRAAKLDVREVRLNDLSLEEIAVRTYRGPLLYFSLRFPADPALGVIQSLIERKEFPRLEYIDFRVKNRAYYK